MTKPQIRVELFEDRACVVRHVVVTPGEGRERLIVEGVSPLYDARRLQVVAPEGVEVESVQVQRWKVYRTGRAEAWHQELLAAENALVAARSALRRADEQLKRAESFLDLTEARARRGWRDQPGELSPLQATFDAQESWVAARQAALLARDTHHQAEQLVVRVKAAPHADPVVDEWAARLIVDVMRRPGASGHLVVKATVPCAAWRPVHRADLGDKSLRWEHGAMVWNHTGEDWDPEELVCSTARPGDHPDAPRLQDDVVRVHRRDTTVVIEARDQVRGEAREGERLEQDVPGVDDGGEVRTFTVRPAPRVQSDGKPVQLQLEAWTTPAETGWLAHPEKSPAAVLRASVHHAGQRPILAGPVQLTRHGQAVGRSDIGYLSPGEPFQLDFGSHDGLRIWRTEDRNAEYTPLTGYQKITLQRRLKLANLGDQTVTVTVRERVPVSEVKEVIVRPPHTNPPLSEGVDKDGFCGWLVAVAPGASVELSLQLGVEAPHNVVLPV